MICRDISLVRRWVCPRQASLLGQARRSSACARAPLRLAFALGRWKPLDDAQATREGKRKRRNRLGPRTFAVAIEKG
jgi:hypothetical protein